MTPILLKFKGIGPYKQEQIIDFKSFIGNQVFLISGETGSGKTYILDAILQALYGESTSNDRNDLSLMRCQYMDEKEKTYIEFIFELKGKTYKFIRKLRAINKRDKSVAYETECDAFFLNNENEFESFFDNPKKERVNDKARELIGLDAEQFKQVIILPQGKFEGFLVANTDNKEKILSTLFGTNKWEKIIENVRQISVDKKEQFEKTKSEIASRVSLLNLNDDEKLEDIIVKKEAELLETKVKLEGFESKSKELEQKFLKEDSLLKKANELKTNELELEKLKQKNAEIEKERAELEKIESAIKVVPFKKSYQVLKEEFSGDRTSYIDKDKKLKDAKETFDKVKKEFDEVEIKKQEIKNKENKKTQNEKKLEELNKNLSLFSDKQAIEKNNEEIKDKICSLKGYILDWDEKLEKAEKEKKNAFESGVKQVPILLEDKNKYAIAKEKAEQIKELNNEIIEFNNKIEENNNELKCLVDTEKGSDLYNNLFVMLQKSLINETSKNLKDGEPCPVCASVSHIKKFEGESGVETATKEFIDYIKQKDARLLELNALNNRLSGDILNTQNKIAKNKELIIKAIGKEYREKDFEKANELYENALKLADNYSVIERDIKMFNEQREVYKNKLEQENLKLTQNESVIKEQEKLLGGLNETELKQKISALKNENEKLAYEIEAFERTSKIVTDKWNNIQVSVNTLSKQIEELTEKLTLNKVKLDKSKNEYLEKLSSENMSEVEFDSVYSKIDDKEKISQRVSEFDIAKKTKENIINALKVELENEDITLIDIEKTREERNFVRQNQDELNKNFALLNESIVKYKKLSKELGTLQTKKENEYNEFLEADSFYKELRGQNGISLHNYVLSKLLQNITIEANVLLSRVDDGRYELLVKDEKIDRQRKFGLNLFVLDHYSGKTRSVNTLSGGEKFLVSLSLCLGLSAVVSSFSGGIRMETIFIDEGFGSLSDYALNDALKILSTMTASRSLVGIISHVERLKENIHAKLLVKKSINGSVTKIEI